MPPTRRALLKAADGTGFSTVALEKVERLGEILAAISEHGRLATTLVLKGGTALNVFSGPPRRLSVDLDFNYVGQLAREAMEEERAVVERDLERLVRRLGYQIQRSSNAFAGRKIYLSYRRTGDGLADRIEIDVNFLHRQPLLAPVRRRMWTAMGSPCPDVALLDFEELAAGKLTALLDRGAARDLWDAAHLPTLSGGAWPTPRSRPIFVAYAGVLPLELPRYDRERLTMISSRDAERLLTPMLIRDHALDVAELRARAESVLEPLLSLTDDEVEFCVRLQRGEIAADLLFPDDPELSSRVAASPPLRWKAQNARDHAARKERNRG